MASIPFHKIKWPSQNSIVYSTASVNIGMILKELLRSYGWNVLETTYSLETLFTNIRERQINLVIIDDNSDSPALATVRKLLNEELAIMTPMICLLSETHKHSYATIQNIGMPEIVQKPLTPNTFVPGFRNIIQTWSEGFYEKIRTAKEEILRGNQETGLRLLTELSNDKLSQPISAISLSVYCRKQGNYKLAEKILLSALQNFPRNLGILIALADFYMHAAMPHLAHKLLATAKNTYGPNHAILVDLVQSAIINNRLDEAITFLKEMQKSEYLERDVNHFLSRCLYSEGREQDIKKINNHTLILQKILRAWESVNTPLNAAS